MGITDRILTGPENNILQHEVVDAPQDSIEVSVNAKGEPSYSVKIYGRDPGDLEQRLTMARALAEEHVAQIRAAKVA